MKFRAFSVAIALGLGCATVDFVPFCPSAIEVPVATPACQAEPGVRRMAEKLAALIDVEAGPFLIQVEFDDFGRVGSMCAQRSPQKNPWHSRTSLAEKMDAIQAVAPGSTCLAGTRLDFNWSGVMWAKIHAEVDRCSREARLGIGRCVEDVQLRRGEIWGGETRSGRLWGLVPGQFYVRAEEGEWRAKALRACVTITTSPRMSSNAAAIQRVIVNFDEVEDCMRTQGWQRLFGPDPLVGPQLDEPASQ